MALPVGCERSAQAVLGFREVATAGRRLIDTSECLPVATLRLERFDSEPTQQHVIGRLVLWVILEARALERLGQRHAGLRGDWVSKHRQPAVAAPILQE